MSESDDEASVDDRALQVLVARRYYVDDASKVQIGTELGISRFKVARLLEQAKQSGVVTIRVDENGTLNSALAERMCDHLGINSVTVINVSGDAGVVRRQVGEAAAQLLGATLTAGETLGLAWGRTLTAMSAALPPLPEIDVVQLTGAIGGDIDDSPVEIVRRVALRSGGTARPIFAPLVVDNDTIAQALRRQPGVAPALELFDTVTTAVVSVGSWDPLDSQLPSAVGEGEALKLLQDGVRADVAALLLSERGELVSPEFQNRCVSISHEQMKAVPRIIAVAGGPHKARAVAAVVRAGLCTELVTDRALAEAVLALPNLRR